MPTEHNTIRSVLQFLFIWTRSHIYCSIQLLILNSNYEVDPTLLAEQGLPFYASTWVVQLLTTNLGMAATFTHLLLWNRDDLRGAWSWARPSALKETWANFNWKFWQDDGVRDQSNDEDLDPHYREMLKASTSYF
jgi:OPT oligopeptide transporter protein